MLLSAAYLGAKAHSSANEGNIKEKARQPINPVAWFLVL